MILANRMCFVAEIYNFVKYPPTKRLTPKKQNPVVVAVALEFFSHCAKPKRSAHERIAERWW